MPTIPNILSDDERSWSRACWPNVVVRTSLIYAMTIHVNLVQAVAHAIVFSQTCAVVAVLTVHMGTKERLFLVFGR